MPGKLPARRIGRAQLELKAAMQTRAGPPPWPGTRASIATDSCVDAPAAAAMQLPERARTEERRDNPPRSHEGPREDHSE
jgi:hypothetical protein